MRGRLIFPFQAVLGQINTQAMAAGYNPVLGESRVSYDPQGNRDTGRRETVTTIGVQVETNVYEQQRQGNLGNAPATLIVLIAHFRDLEAANLVDANGRAKIRVNDRLIRILNPAGQVETEFPNPPGVFCTEVTPIGYGFGGRRNLLLIRFGDRPQDQVKQ